MYSRPVDASESVSLLEVYKTDEENFKPYEPKSGGSSSVNLESKKQEAFDNTKGESKEKEEEELDENKEGFTLHQGEIIETYYYSNMKELGFEADYVDIDLNGRINFAEIKDLTRFYKGVRLLLRKKLVAPDETVTIEDLGNVLLGFITEEKFNESGMELSISSFTKLLEKEYKFEFTQMKRSEILIEMIKTAGLEPEVDPTGLQDDVIDYTNISSSGDGGDDSGSVGGEYASINEFVKKAIKGKSGARAKAEAIHNALKAIIRYSYYSCSHYSHDPEACLKNAGHLNCADTACLTRACMSAGGLTARVVHGPNHFWTEVKIDGKWVASDLTGCTGCQSRRGLGEVYNGLSKDSVCGDFPSC